ncbi:anion/proton exchange transporter Gef1p [[Candida] railenensis]|uniref:Chloride channel protein n=1 Tax=[Candida] railenensis TaxID=45579 RepID=A0A9P0VXN1_9ASCO|nr:anion/proton exchange transporter Gef1p [[Candida] railenensis]
MASYELDDEHLSPENNFIGDNETRNLRSRKTGSWLNQEEIKEVVRYDQFITIDWMQDELQEHKKLLAKKQELVNSSGTASIQDRFLSFTLNWFVLAIMGIFIGVIAATLNIMTAWLSNIRLGHCSGAIYLNKSFCCWNEAKVEGSDTCSKWVSWSDYFVLNYFMYILFSFIFSFSAAFIVKKFAPSAAGSGISEIKCIVSGFVMEGFLGWWTLLIKSLGLPLAIGSGLSVGKEGPSVHYAVCVGNCVSKIFEKYRKSASKAREFLTATAAAGVAVAFGSPMGGVLFSMEEISSVFQLSTIWKSYFCALIAVTTLAAINPFGTGQLVMFEVTYDTNWHYFEIPSYILLGIFGGVYGIIVSKYNKRVVSFRKKYLSNYALREVVTLAILTASFSYFNEFLKIDMTESMEILFHECGKGFDHPMCDPDSKKTLLIFSLLFATISRMVLTIFTYGCKVPAGIFVPSMAAGATFGRAIGVLMDMLHSSHPNSSIFLTCPTPNSDGTTPKCIIPGTYAFLGAAAALSGITHLTVTVVIIMFELTGALRYIIPTMIVVAITKSINDKWGEGGIADQMIKFNGLPLIEVNEEHHFNNDLVIEAMSTVTVTLPFSRDESVSISQLRKILSKTKFKGFPVIQSFSIPKIIGYATRTDLLHVLSSNDQSTYDDAELCDFSKENGPFNKILNHSPVIINKDTTIGYLLDIFHKLGPRYVLVENEVGLLCGLVTRKDVLRYEHSIADKTNVKHLRKVEDEFNDKVWNLMLYCNISMRKTLGKLFHNNENRYL